MQVIATRRRLGALLIPVALLLIASAIPFVPPLLRGEVFSVRDHFDYFVPLRHFTAAALRGGEVPLWNPFNGSGEPWLANPQTGVFYPLSWVFLILPYAAAYTLYLWAHIVILGVGAFVLFRRWATPDSAVIAAAALMLCGPTMSLLDISNNLGSLAWLPWVLYAALERRTMGWRVPLSVDAVLITLMFLGGEPFLAATGAFLYALIVATSGRFVPLILVAVLSTLLSGAQLLPFVEMIGGSDRLSASRSAPRSPIPGDQRLGTEKGLMPPRDWLRSFVPPVDPVTSPGVLIGPPHYILSMYLGIPLIFAAAAAAALARRLERQRQMIIAAGLSIFLLNLVLSAGSTWWSVLPLEVTRYPSRLVALATLVVAGLGAIGFDLLAMQSRVWRIGAAMALVLSSTLAILLFSSGRGPWSISVMLFWCVLLVTLLLVRPGAFGAPLFLLPLIVLDHGIAAKPLLRTQPLEKTFSPYSQLVQPPLKVARLISQGATLNSEQDRRYWMSGYLNLLAGCFDAGTPAPVASARYLRLQHAALTQPRVDIVDFLSIGFFATVRDIRHPDFEPVARAGPVRLFRNRNAGPVTQIWSDYRVVPENAAGDAKAIDAIDMRKTVQVSCRPGESCDIPDPEEKGRGRDSAVLSFVSLRELSIQLSVAQQSLVTLSQLDAPGWRVSIDGEDAPPLRAHGLFRAVIVPRGDHQVIWRYRPRSMVMGITMSTIALVMMVGEILAVCRRRRRESIS